MGFSPYYLLYGVNPILPLSLFEATYHISGFQKNPSTAELLALQIQQLAKHDNDINRAAQMLYQSQSKSNLKFEQQFHK